MPTKKQLITLGKKALLDEELNAYFANPAQARIDYAQPPPVPVVVKPRAVRRPKSGMRSTNQKFITPNSLGTQLAFDNRLMNRVMANRPQGFAQPDIGFAVPKAIPKPVVVIQAKTTKKARKPRASKAVKKARAPSKKKSLQQKYDERLKKIEDAYQACARKGVAKCTSSRDKKVAYAESFYKGGIPKRAMSQQTKDLLASIRLAKKAGTYVAPTPEQRRAAANLKAKARRFANKGRVMVV